MDKPTPLSTAEVSPRTKPSNYPAAFASQVAGRQKQTLGDAFGQSSFGVNHTTLKPGAISALRHWHTLQDEFIYILSGQPTLITDAGETLMQPGMCMGFKGGVRDGQQLVNRTADDVIYLEIGDRQPGDAGYYPDDDLKAVMDADGKWQFLHKDSSPY